MSFPKRGIKCLVLFMSVTCLISLKPQLGHTFDNIKFIFEIGSLLQEPVDVALADNGRICVLDRKACKILVFDDEGTLIREIGSRGSKEGQLREPNSLTVTSNNLILVADTRNNRVQAFSIEGEYLFGFGNRGTERGRFKDPVAVTMDQNGFILVADESNDRIQIFSPQGLYRFYLPVDGPPSDIAVDSQNRLYVLLPEQKKVSRFSPNKRGEDIFCIAGKKNYTANAQRMAVDAGGGIFISESMEHSIKKFNDENELLHSFGSEGDRRGQFELPAGIAIGNDNLIYVADSRNKRVQAFEMKGLVRPSKKELQTASHVYYDRELAAEKSLVDVHVDDRGNVLALAGKGGYLLYRGIDNRIIAEPGKGTGQIRKARAIDFGPDGNIYVADTGNNRVQIFDRKGEYIRSFGKRGSKTGQFKSPKGIVVNSKGIVYVADSGNQRIQIFNSNGIFFHFFGSESKTGRDETPLKGTFRNPTALALDSKDNLYVVDQENNRIQVFDENGNFIRFFGSPGTSYSQFDRPVDIAIGSDDVIYVAEAGNHRIQIFSKDEPRSIVFGAEAAGYGNFQELSGIDVQGNSIYVTDGESDKLRIYSYHKGTKVPGATPKEVPERSIEVPKEKEGGSEFELQ